MDEFFEGSGANSAKANDPSFAIVGAVVQGGVTLIFPGETEASQKVYKCARGIPIYAGDRVHLLKDSGTYVVEYAIDSDHEDDPGGTQEVHNVPPGGTKGQLLGKAADEDYNVGWYDPPKNYIPTGGTIGQMLVKGSTTNYALTWASAPEDHVPTGGTDGQMLVKDGTTARKLKWEAAPTSVPKGGSTGQTLVKNSNKDGDVNWAAPTVTATKLANGSYAVNISATGVATPNASGSIKLGTSALPFGDFYANGIIVLANAYNNTVQIGGSTAKLGFFGKTPIARKTLATSSTLSQVIQALKDYGLFG